MKVYVNYYAGYDHHDILGVAKSKERAMVLANERADPQRLIWDEFESAAYAKDVKSADNASYIVEEFEVLE